MLDLLRERPNADSHRHLARHRDLCGDAVRAPHGRSHRPAGRAEGFVRGAVSAPAPPVRQPRNATPPPRPTTTSAVATVDRLDRAASGVLDRAPKTRDTRAAAGARD